MNASAMLPAILTALGVAGAIAVARSLSRFMKRAISREFRSAVSEVVGEDLKQLKPNGGASLRDAVDRIERRLDKLEDKLGG